MHLKLNSSVFFFNKTCICFNFLHAHTNSICYLWPKSQFCKFRLQKCKYIRFGRANSLKSTLMLKKIPQYTDFKITKPLRPNISKTFTSSQKLELSKLWRKKVTGALKILKMACSKKEIYFFVLFLFLLPDNNISV